MKKLLLVAGLGMLSLLSVAQQDPMFTHYMFNTLAINSGYAGSRSALTATLLGRYQWVNLDGAPQTHTLTLHSPLLHEKLGVGLSVVQDRIGPIRQTSLYGDFAYKFNVTDKGVLSLGIKAGMNVLNGDLTSLHVTDAGDDAFTGASSGGYGLIQSRLLPNLGFGAYYSQERFYVGLSTPKLLENGFIANQASGSSTLNRERRHFFAIAGAVFDLVPNIKLKPTALLKVVQNAPVELDVSASFIFRDKLSLGVMGRTRDGIGFLIGYQFTDQFRAGYSYDQALTRLRSVNRGTHEIMLSYDFMFKEKGKIKSPRYF